jgi:deoxyribodipyrimidine photo-lyase
MKTEKKVKPMVGSGEVPAVRIQRLNQHKPSAAGDYVVYWMTANRRLTWNFALDRAVEYCRQLNKPLLIFEALRCDYQWASRRLHAFVLRGMQDNQAIAARHGHQYVPWVEQEYGGGSGLLETIASRAAVVVTDDYPCFFLPAMTRAVARRIGVLLEAVDSNGLLPMRATSQVFPTAYAFRRYLQKSLPEHLVQFPEENALADPDVPRLVQRPEIFRDRWAPAGVDLLTCTSSALDRLPIDQSTKEGLAQGGAVAASGCLDLFLQRRLSRYGEERNEPDADVASGLSPYLHFGQVSVHDIFTRLSHRESWSRDQLGDPKKTKGSRNGWWGMSDAAESFLDELVTWRELGFNMCSKERHYDRWESLPEWAQKTLNEHKADPRPYKYSLEQLRDSRTHDPVWNAAQRQLMQEGRMQNYLRMLWGKKVLEWSPTPEQALDVLIELNNRYALDGRDPNSYSGIFWVFGRYDRAWGPERPIFGKIRYMTSDSTVRKLDLKRYLQRYGR